MSTHWNHKHIEFNQFWENINQPFLVLMKKEIEIIWLKSTANEPRPHWTQPILRKYNFNRKNIITKKENQSKSQSYFIWFNSLLYNFGDWYCVRQYGTLFLCVDQTMLVQFFKLNFFFLSNFLVMSIYMEKERKIVGCMY